MAKTTVREKRRERRRRPGRDAIMRLALARGISLLGSMAAFSALPYILFQRTDGSNTWVSVAMLMTFGAQGVFSPLGGALGDRLDRRRVWIASEVAAAAGFVVLAFARTPLQMVVMAFVTATLESPIWPVSGAAVPNLVGEEDVSWANGTISIGRNIGNLIGPVIGGVLLGILAADNTEEQFRTAGYVIYGINAVSFLVSAWLVASVRRPFSGGREGEEHGGIVAGFRFIRHDRVLLLMTFAWVVLLLGAGFTVVADVALSDLFRAGSVGYGFLLASWGGGAILGSLLGQRVLNAEREPAGLVWSTVAFALGMGLISVAPLFPFAVAMTLAAGTGEGFGGVAEQGIFQRRTPDEVRSRVMGAAEAAIMVAFAASFAFGGPLLDAVGVRWAYAIGGMSTLVAAGIVALGMHELVRERAGS